MQRIFAHFLLAIVLVISAASTSFAVEPSLRTINIRGLQIGGTTEIVCDGDDLTAEPKLLLPFAAQTELKAGSTDKKATFVIKLGDDVQPGYYQLRMATAGGLSQPIVIGVDRLRQQALSALAEQLPVAVHGSVSGSSILEARFQGKKGEFVTIEIEAQRLGSKLKPVLHLYNATGKQIGWHWPQTELFNDARLEATLPADGEFRVSIHDLEYAASNPSFFRLKIGQWTRCEQVFPAVIAAGAERRVEVRTQVEKSTASEQQTVPANALGQAAQLAVAVANFSGPRPFVRLSPQTELLEAAAQNGELSLNAGPIGISGQLLSVQEEDRYKVAVKPGDKIRCEIFGQRHGAPLDAKLIIRNEQERTAQGEDSPGTLDPLLEYTVPDKVTSVVVCVVASQGRAGPQAAYHLNLRNANDAAATSADFRLVTNCERTAVAKSGRWVLPVWLDRRGYQGPIELSANNLPAGLSLAGTTIQPGNTGTLVTITADESEPAERWGITQWQGKAADGKTKPMVLKNHPLEMLQPWLAEEVAIARANSSSADFSIEWRDLPETAALQPTSKLPLPIKLTRADDKPPVRLSLITSQLVTLNNNQPDPNKTLRAEKAVELGAKINDGEIAILAPRDLDEDAYDVAVQAELLSADKQKVLGTAFTPVRRLPVQMPVEVKLAGEPKTDVMLDPAKGAMQKIEGTIKRREGITGDVTIAVAGLPNGVRADSPTVKADASEFALTITLPANQAAGEISGLKLSASIAPDPKQANVRVKSRDVEFKLNVVRPTP